MQRRTSTRSLPALAALALLGAVGCAPDQSAGAGLAPAVQIHTLAQAPDCAEATVTADYAASAADVDGYYLVSDGARVVCGTDFDGLQVLALRFEGATPSAREMLSSEPMPGRGNNPRGGSPSATGNAASEPMPGRGNGGGAPDKASSDVGASEPMPGRGNSTGDSRPVPVRDPTSGRILRAATR